MLRKRSTPSCVGGKALFEGVKRKTEPGAADSVVPGFLRPIDTGKIAHRLKLAERGLQRGSQGLPAPEERLLDSVEQSIVQWAVSEWAWHREQLLTELRSYAERLSSFSIHAKLARLTLTANNARTQFINAQRQAGSELGALKQAYLDARDELQGFRARYKLNRPARHPSRRFTTWGLLIFLIGIESLLNGVFFAKGSQFGLIGGVTTAVGISAFNIVAAFLVGLWPARLVNHRNYFFKLVGLIFVLAGVAGLILLHAFAAHFREATALLGEEGAINRAIDTLENAPFTITDPNSAYLFGLGILCATLAYLKGYRSDDPFPRYGAVSRRADRARHDYNDEHLELFGELEELKENTVAELKTSIDEIPLYANEVERLRGARKSRLEEYQAYEIALEAAVNELLSVYRDANRSARKNLPVPGHFSQAWKLERSFLEGIDIADPEPVRTSELPKIKAELISLADAVLAEYTNLIQRYPHPDEM